jgi:hypothetical protein
VLSSSQPPDSGLPNSPLSLAGGGAVGPGRQRRSVRLWLVLREALRRKRAISEIANDAGEADDDPDCHTYDYCIHLFPLRPLIPAPNSERQKDYGSVTTPPLSNEVGGPTEPTQ